MSKIRSAAGRQGKGWTLQREGGDHEIWQCGSIRVPIGRHNEIGEHLAERIRRELEGELGKGWWRR
jgi:hypothetical protein